jgi:natural resistance-associated macrophage protein
MFQGFLGLKWAKWKRVLLTRSIAMVPCVIIGAVAANKLDILDDYINVEQSLLLPFSVLPVLFATTSKRIMKEHRSNIVLTVIAWIIALIVMGVNCSFVIESIVSGAPVYAIVLASVGLLLYFSIIAFFIIFPIIKEIKYWRMTKKSNGYEQIN